jgi:D-methionine transport system substrate-binding protein
MAKKFASFLCALFFLTGCSTEPKKELKVAATAIPHAQMLEFVKPRLKSLGINLIIVVVEDYNLPNRLLADGSVDANFFQHVPFMEEQIEEYHYAIESIAKIELEPMGIYSKKIKSLSELSDSATIAIPNDTADEARALMLLQKNGVIELDNSNPLQATLTNITKNPKHIQFITINAALVAGTLDNVDAAAINANFALQAKLSPLEDSLALESKDSTYANVIVVRIGDENRPDIQTLKNVMTSQPMREFIVHKYKGAVIPAF